ncbi:MAG: addiction module antitoxin [Chloroflexi bacterium]|nr:addiction module antitoxin [Chloroflexota bacterium]
MHKKLTVTMDERVYEAMHRVIGRGSISRFIEDLVRPHVMEQDLEASYQEMAKDEERENEALEWAEAMIGDIDGQPR